MKACSKCREMLPLNSFYADNRRRDGYESQCKPCRKDKLEATKSLAGRRKLRLDGATICARLITSSCRWRPP